MSGWSAGVTAGAATVILAVGGFVAHETVTGQPGYDRAEFGDGWADLDGDSCRTRDEILTRDSTTPGSCPPRPGPVTIRDPYTGRIVTGRGDIDIDHVFALVDAWDSGADAWTRPRRVAFANDEQNLVATADDVNRVKGGRGPDGWRPPDPGGWCRYAGIYRDTATRWGLTLTPGQEAALAELGRGCGGAR
ncbi:MAG: hypothetical protein ACRD0V_21475 [Acidimicrobiales bacterium]